MMFVSNLLLLVNSLTGIEGNAPCPTSVLIQEIKELNFAGQVAHRAISRESFIITAFLCVFLVVIFHLSVFVFLGFK